MAVIAFVPVRKGSKSIKNKNIKPFCGKPLVYWVLAALNDSPEIDEVYLATDGHQIAAAVEEFGLEKVRIYMRDSENATDSASTESVMLEFIRKHSFHNNDLFVLAQATSPFTKAVHFTEAVNCFNKSDGDSLLSVVRQKRFFWDADNQPLNYDFKNRPRRQDFEGYFMENGAFYISTMGQIEESQNRLSGKIIRYEMPEYTGLELDEPLDWTIGELLMKDNLAPDDRRDVSRIKLVLSDVDGVLTDAGMYYSEAGDELKKFSTYDGMAFRLLKEKGLQVGIMTAEDRELNRRRADKMKLDFQYHGVRNKLALLDQLLNELGLTYAQVAYVGDDINDVEVLQHVGLAACPANAQQAVLDVPGIVKLPKKGGEGVIRELFKFFED